MGNCVNSTKEKSSVRIEKGNNTARSQKKAKKPLLIVRYPSIEDVMKVVQKQEREKREESRFNKI